MAQEPQAGARFLGYLSLVRGAADAPVSYSFYELWGFSEPTDEAALIASAARAVKIPDAASGKIWSKKAGYYDTQDKVRKKFPKDVRNSSGIQTGGGSLVTGTDPNAVEQTFKEILSNNYRGGIIPKPVRFSTPRVLGSIIISCGPEDATMTSFKVYEWFGTAYPRHSRDRYLTMPNAINEALGIGKGKGCRLTDTVTGLTGQAAVEAMYSRMKGLRKYISASVVNTRITTDDELRVLGVSAAGEAVAGQGKGSSGGSTGTGNTGGVSHSTADMSQFTRNAGQGAIMLYYGWDNKPASAYIYELRGSTLKDKKAIADLLVKRTSQSGGTFIGFEHFPGNCRQAQGYIRRKAGDGIATTCSGEYKID